MNLRADPRRKERGVKPSVAADYDLVGVAGFSLVYLLVLLLAPGSVLQALLGLPFALFLPGYALLAATESHQETMQLATRLAMSCVLSLALVTLLALGLNAIAQLTLVALVLGIELIVIGSCIVAVGRRNRLTAARRIPLEEITLSLRRKPGPALFLGVVLVVGLVFATQAVVSLLAGEEAETYTTAFYLLGEEGMAGSYPDEVRLGQPFPATLGIINKERGPASYRVEMRIDGQSPQNLAQVSLEPGETWERTFDVTIWQAGGDTARVDFYLYREPDRTPYRSVHQRVRIAGPPSGSSLPSAPAGLAQGTSSLPAVQLLEPASVRSLARSSAPAITEMSTATHTSTP
jgi:uncharacterized membrane protein